MDPNRGEVRARNEATDVEILPFLSNPAMVRNVRNLRAPRRQECRAKRSRRPARNEATVLAIDPDGADLGLHEQSLRMEFHTPVFTAEALRKKFAELAYAARTL